MLALTTAIIETIQNSSLLTGLLGKSCTVYDTAAPETASFPFCLVNRITAAETEHYFSSGRIEFPIYQITFVSNSDAQVAQAEDIIYNVFDMQSLSLDSGYMPLALATRVQQGAESVRDAYGNTVYRSIIRVKCIAQDVVS